MKSIVVAALLVLTLAPPALANDRFRRVSKRIPDRYVVVFENHVRDEHAAAADLVRRHGGRDHRVYRHALKGFSVTLPEAAAMRLSHDPRVRFIEEVPVIELYETQTNATWGLDRVDQRHLPLDGLYVYDDTASGVTVYVLDSGIRITHPEFEGRASVGFDAFTYPPGSPGYMVYDCSGHGTHVAGTIGSASYGVAKGVTLISVRVLDPCPGLDGVPDVIGGIDWMISDHASGPAVANMSFGGPASSALDLAVGNAIADGITCVVASGNNAEDACDYSPARVSGAITVNASDSADYRAYFSNWGTCTDLFAPGYQITSTYTAPAVPHWEATASGTSMAAPHVSGAAALYLSLNPSAAPDEVWEAIRDAATTNVLNGIDSTTPNRLLFISNASQTADASSMPSSMLALAACGLAIVIARSTVT